jgi:hypothetical protein
MTQVPAHSTVIGGSTASRVIGCPGSVALVAKMPPKPSSEYADKGTLLHDVMSDLLSSEDAMPEDFLGREYNGIKLTQDMIDAKVIPALEALNEIDPNTELELEVESRVGFGDLIPGAFGSADVIGRLGRRTIVLDWKFGDGVPVPAENNKQLLFYAAAARVTPKTAWAFEDTDELELIIVQPPHVRRWVTGFKTLDLFVHDMTRAVKKAQLPNAPLAVGDHCRWCAAKPICPKMTGAAERVLQLKLNELDAEAIGKLLAQADLVEDWIKDLRGLAYNMLENDKPVPGYKLVAKKATRQWVDEAVTKTKLAEMGVKDKDLYKPQELISPAQAEKLLKKSKLALPDDLVVAVSSGSTLAPESDPRPAVLNIGKQLTAALSKLQ